MDLTECGPVVEMFLERGEDVNVKATDRQGFRKMVREHLTLLDKFVRQYGAGHDAMSDVSAGIMGVDLEHVKVFLHFRPEMQRLLKRLSEEDGPRYPPSRPGAR